MMATLSCSFMLAPAKAPDSLSQGRFIPEEIGFPDFYNSEARAATFSPG
jgi:hypothetical protein